MAGPLDFLGGLAQVGGRGAAGSMEGLVEGEKLKRTFANEDIQNQIRQIELMLKQRQMGQPVPYQPGTVLTDPNTGQVLQQLPQAPMTPLQQAQIDAHRANARLHDRQTDQVGIQPAPQLDAKTKQALDEWRANPSNQGRSLMDFHREFAIANHPPAPHAPQAPNVAFQRDAQGNVTQIITRVDPTTGKVVTEKIPQGAIGMPQRPVGGAGAGMGRETTTRTEVTGTGKELVAEDVARYNGMLPEIVKELSAKQGFNVPGPFVHVPGYGPIRKEDIIAKIFKDRFKVDVKLVWDPEKPGWFGTTTPGSFKIVRGNAITQRKTDSSRTSAPRTAQDEEDEE